jgi:hypothetical protein
VAPFDQQSPPVQELVEAGRARSARRGTAEAPEPGPDLSGELVAQRDAELKGVVVVVASA